jgi:hypothetical protein
MKTRLTAVLSVTCMALAATGSEALAAQASSPDGQRPAMAPKSKMAPRAMHPRQAISPFNASVTSMRAGEYYQMHWGVDSLVVKSVPSNQLIRFSYRVVDASKAGALVGKEVAPQLYDEQSRVSLVVPTMDKVGQLRQTGPAENGKTYWMVFSNKGNVVKPGHRVGVVIGQFRANGLAVE